MNRNPQTVAVNEVVGSIDDGIAVVVLSVDFWADRVVVNLAAAGERTEVLTAEWNRRFDEWQAGGCAGRLPRDPSDRLIRDVRVQVTDDEGAPYALRIAGAGGDGNQWSAQLVYTSGAVGDGVQLTITTASGTREFSVRTPLTG